MADFLHWSIIIFIFYLALLILKIVERIPVISPAPYSGPLFSINSNVQDWYGGQLEGAFYSIGHYEYSFFMYYAPWDAKSQYAAKVVNEVADIFKDRVYIFCTMDINYFGEFD